MEIFLHMVDFSADVALAILAVLLGIVGIVGLFFFVFLPIHQVIYNKYDRQGAYIPIQGRVLEKRYNDGAYSAVIQVDSIIVNMPLPYDIFRSIQEGAEIDLQALYGRLSKQILAVEPTTHHIDTFA